MKIEELMPSLLMLALLIACVPLALRVIKKRKNGASAPEQRESLRARSVQDRNGTKDDYLEALSRLTNFARKHRFQMLVPGTVKAGEEIAVLSALMITRSCVLGISCFGYGGVLQGREGDADWIQTINGKRRNVPSPAKKLREKEAILKKALAQAGCGKIAVEMVGIFTTPGARLENADGSGCILRESMVPFLQQEKFLADKGIVPREAVEKIKTVLYREEA